MNSARAEATLAKLKRGRKVGPPDACGAPVRRRDTIVGPLIGRVRSRPPRVSGHAWRPRRARPRRTAHRQLTYPVGGSSTERGRTMLKLALLAAAVLAGATGMAAAALGHDDDEPRRRGAFATVFASPTGIEGLTADRRGNLYTAGRAPAADAACPVVRIAAGGGAATTVGTTPPPCGPAGLTFGRDGRLFIADSGRIVVLKPDETAPPAATEFATGVPGANGVAFDKRGTLWVSDGVTSQGRVWRVSPAGAVE